MKKKANSLILLTLLTLLPAPGLLAQEFRELNLGGAAKTAYTVSPRSSSRIVAADPFITEVVQEISPDSIRATLQSLQDWGTRFMLNDNRKEIAEWLADRFRSFGMTDVVLDSFLCYVDFSAQFTDTLWEYNVVARLQGTSAPGEEYIVGGHYDSYSAPDPFQQAPGVNDNGSAVAATLEIARVMMKKGVVPEATVRFELYAAEELGLFGSLDLARKAYEQGRDIRYVLNMDMIANNPDNHETVTLLKYPMCEWAAFYAAWAFGLYAGIEGQVPDNYFEGGSDSWSYFLYGFPAIFVQETDFSPHWHRLSDTLGNCNINYLTQNTAGACATLLEQQVHPYPAVIRADGNTEHITIHWKGTENARLKGYNLYRSEQPDGGFMKLNSALIPDTVYIDAEIEKGKPYFYAATSLNDLDEESIFSPVVQGIIFHFSDTLLVINQLKAELTAPDSVYQWYQEVMDTIPFEWHDLNTLNPVTLQDLATHKNILWVSNRMDYDVYLHPGYDNLKLFFSNGGNMVVSTFNPSRMLEGITQYPFKFPEGSLLHDYFKVDSTHRTISSIMYRAYPAYVGYDTLNIDSLRPFSQNFPGEIYNVEGYTPTQQGTVIYRFDSHYPPTVSQGAMQDDPIGLEYMGDDFKTILLGFPIYYTDEQDARAFMKFIMESKLSHPVAVPDHTDRNQVCLKVFPNPAHGGAYCSFTLDQPSSVLILIYDMQGRKVLTLSQGNYSPGTATVKLSLDDFAPGIYQVILRAGNSQASARIVLK